MPAESNRNFNTFKYFYFCILFAYLYTYIGIIYWGMKHVGLRWVSDNNNIFVHSKNIENNPEIKYFLFNEGEKDSVFNLDSYKPGTPRGRRQKRSKQCGVKSSQHSGAGQYKKCVQYDFRFTSVYKCTRGGRPTTTIPSPNHILIIFSSEPHRHPRPSNIIFFKCPILANTNIF